MKSRNKIRVVSTIKGAQVARAAAYLTLAIWAVMLFVFPPTAFVNALDMSTKVIWLGTTAVGALVALVGVINGRDLKVEFPGTLFMLAGPLFYAMSQLWYILFPAAASGPGLPVADPTQRYALFVFAIYAFLVTLPRVLELREVRHQTYLAHLNKILPTTLTEAQAAQPGAFPEFDRRDSADVGTDSSDPLR